MSGWTEADLAAYTERLKLPPADAAPPKPKRKPSDRKEEQIQKQIIDLLEAYGWLVMRTNKFCGASISSQGAIEPGMPDLQARKIRSGDGDWEDGDGNPGHSLAELIWIEVKRPGGKVSTIQATWHQLARKRGETVLVAESVDAVAAAIGVTL